MGKRKSKVEKTAKRNIRIQRTDTKAVCENKEGKKEKPKNKRPSRKQTSKPVNIVDADQIKITIEHFFGGKINKIIDRIDDPRKIEMCTYTLNHLTWLGILMFILRLESRNQLLMERETYPFLSNLLSLSSSDEDNVAHPDTMNYLFEILPIEEFEFLKIQLVKELIRKKVVDPYRLLGSICIAVDATGIFSFKTRHCKSCLVTKHNDKTTTYSHKMLEAKLVSPNGFAFSVCSESIENIDEEYVKQDCELKAFYRMEKNLKKLLPRTPICLLLDGIYACEEVFNICKKNNWDFIVVLKQDRIPTLYKEAEAKKNADHANNLTIGSRNEIETLSWVQNLQYRKYKLHAIFSQKIEINGSKEIITNNTWVTNIRPKINNVEKLVKKGGRQRWKIENQGFKEQKCDGYNLEHLYGEEPTAWKNYYQLLQIAHMISQLMILGDLCIKLQEHANLKDNYYPVKSFKKYYNSISNFIKRLCESFRNDFFSCLTAQVSDLANNI